MIRRKAGLALTLTLALAFGGSAAVVTSGCSHLAAPAQLGPVGDVAYRARQALALVTTMVDAAADGVQSDVISKADGLRIADAGDIAHKTGAGLVKALEAGEPEEGAKKEFLAALREALKNLPDQLEPKTGDMIRGYTALALTLLSIYGS